MTRSRLGLALLAGALVLVALALVLLHGLWRTATSTTSWLAAAPLAGLIVAGVVLAMILFSYSPDDPGIGTATDQPAQNLLGRLGAYVASALVMIVGFGAWVLPLVALGWGLRLMLHRGEDRLVRAVFLPIAMVLLSIYATSIVPPASASVKCCASPVRMSTASVWSAFQT